MSQTPTQSAVESVANVAIGYVVSLAASRRLHRDIDAVYDDAQLRALLPGLDTRRRLALIRADLSDIGHPAVEPGEPPVFSGGTIDVPTALGWLYVAEGRPSNERRRLTHRRRGLSWDKNTLTSTVAADSAADRPCN